MAVVRPMCVMVFRKALRLIHLLTAGVAFGGAAEKAAAVEAGRTSYESGERRIKVETFLPNGTGRHPAVLVLYGSGGALLGKNQMEDIARKLAADGKAAFLIHYFNRTGTIVAANDKPITAHWRTWEQTVREGVDFVARHPRVRPEAIGMLGYSLGAFLAVGVSTTDARIGAVVEIAGGMFEGVAERARRFPPMLVLHGRDDERVPVARAPELQALARKFGARPEMKLYEGEGHGLSNRAAADALARALTFFRRHLPAQ